jgi:hypothetical protein
VKPPAVLVFKGLGDDADVPVLLPGKVCVCVCVCVCERERERERERSREVRVCERERERIIYSVEEDSYRVGSLCARGGVLVLCELCIGTL